MEGYPEKGVASTAACPTHIRSSPVCSSRCAPCLARSLRSASSTWLVSEFVVTHPLAFGVLVLESSHNRPLRCSFSSPFSVLLRVAIGFFWIPLDSVMKDECENVY